MIAFEISAVNSQRNKFSDVVQATIKSQNSNHVKRRKWREGGLVPITDYQMLCYCNLRSLSYIFKIGHITVTKNAEASFRMQQLC